MRENLNDKPERNHLFVVVFEKLTWMKSQHKYVNLGKKTKHKQWKN